MCSSDLKRMTGIYNKVAEKCLAYAGIQLIHTKDQLIPVVLCLDGVTDRISLSCIPAIRCYFIVNASLKGSATQEKVSEENDCNVPWAILLDPNSACNLHCTGCWAAEYGHKLNLDLETIDSIVKQGKELGTYMYIYTGGEPLVRKKDLIKICEMNPDCEFLSFKNGTLIDEEFCQEMLRVKNFVPAISLREQRQLQTDVVVMVYIRRLCMPWSF